MSEPVRRVEIFTGTGRRRPWSAAEKAAIVAESLAPGANVSAVARRHGLTPQQVFTWRRLARGTARHGAAFVPVMLEDACPEPAGCPVVEVAVGAMTVRIPPGADPTTVAMVLRAAQAAL